MQFPHEKLSVYQKALDFFGGIPRDDSLYERMVSKAKWGGCLSHFLPIVNCLANASETNSIGNFAENSFYRFCVAVL